MTAKHPCAVTVRISGSGRNVGKTTLVTRLISRLTDRGVRVSALKRTHHPLPPDDAGSDTDLMARAGAARVAFVGPDGMLERSRATSLEVVLARLSADAEVVIVEGYRDESLDLQFHLVGAPPAQVEVTIGDAPSTRTLSADDIEAIAELIEAALGRQQAP